jgi:NADPH-dependent ferric siderophore reductase
MNVILQKDITPNMKRITLGGEDLKRYPPDQAGSYIKLALEEPGQSVPVMRTYTIRNHREDSCEIDVDFVLHGDNGPASAWAGKAKPGDQILVGGPGPKKTVNLEADWYFLVADMTALPALSVNLETLPESAKGYAVIEVLDEKDIQQLKAPEGIEINWVVASNNDIGREKIIECVRSRTWLDGRVGVWAASEFETMRALRQYFKKELKLPTSDAYISSYWKNGLREDEHKVAKRQDAMAE